MSDALDAQYPFANDRERDVLQAVWSEFALARVKLDAAFQLYSARLDLPEGTELVAIDTHGVTVRVLLTDHPDPERNEDA